LVLVVAALAALALIVANTAGLLLIRTYLRDRIDERLTAMGRPFATAGRPKARSRSSARRAVTGSCGSGPTRSSTSTPPTARWTPTAAPPWSPRGRR
jgi:hypothetical protein